MHSILVIGAGSIGERHLRCFLNTGRARVTACDTDPVLLQTIAKTYHAPVATDWQQAIASGQFGAVVVCTPAPFHVPMATQALQRGLDVLIEKPLSQSLAGVADLIALRDATRRRAVVAYVLHVYPLLTQAREFLQAGELGPVLHATCTSGQYFPGGRPAHAVPYAKTYYRDRRTGGGAIQDALTHTANWMESVLGPTDSVLCDCAHQALPEVTVEDTVNLSARHGRVLVNYTLNQFQAPNESTLQFNTARGSVKIELHHRRWGSFRLGDKDWTWHEVPAADRDAPFQSQANRFLDLIEGKSAPMCSLEAALQTLRFNLSAIASAETGARVHCATVPDCLQNPPNP
ncbi:Gfo/Idh/MocA family oxidoreductase [Opitutus sp. GAS368]|uniref:Gfo/Idh/MocA family protein n=1 Tax=Opitutus sp. GAS368 TaxID=1882749 RepID=UPI00087C5017|nr:Gfo/Idh/MocA family oxidoreductase [Opitutus sp. GAS368]SDS47415.1 Predicted dehydrogenase [Opitutus sp. GAS368]